MICKALASAQRRRPAGCQRHQRPHQASCSPPIHTHTTCQVPCCVQHVVEHQTPGQISGSRHQQPQQGSFLPASLHGACKPVAQTVSVCSCVASVGVAIRLRITAGSYAALLAAGARLTLNLLPWWLAMAAAREGGRVPSRQVSIRLSPSGGSGWQLISCCDISSDVLVWRRSLRHGGLLPFFGGYVLPEDGLPVVRWHVLPVVRAVLRGCVAGAGANPHRYAPRHDSGRPDVRRCCRASCCFHLNAAHAAQGPCSHRHGLLRGCTSA